MQLAVDKRKAIDMYVNDGVSTKAIAEHFGCSGRYIQMVLTEAGVDISTNKRRKVMHHVNESFFKEWSSDMAYVLGMMLTDGNVSGNSFSISQKEPDILYAIRDAMDASQPVTRRVNNESSFVHFLPISRRSMVLDLAALGIGPNKSLTVTLPDVPDEYMADFLRGVIDGDGWVHPKGYTMIITSGSKVFSTQVCEVLKNNGLNSSIPEDSGAYRIKVSGKEDILRMGRWLYTDPGVLFLPRKRTRFEYHAS